MLRAFQFSVDFFVPDVAAVPLRIFDPKSSDGLHNEQPCTVVHSLIIVAFFINVISWWSVGSTFVLKLAGSMTALPSHLFVHSAAMGI